MCEVREKWFGKIEFSAGLMFLRPVCRVAVGQFETVWQTPGGVIGDAWSDFLPDSKPIVADWTSPISCGNYNISTGKCSGQNY